MDPSGGSYAEGERVTLIAETSSGYYFTGWGNISDDSESSAFENEVEIIMPAENLEITAGFCYTWRRLDIFNLYGWRQQSFIIC